MISNLKNFLILPKKLYFAIEIPGELCYIGSIKFPKKYAKSLVRLEKIYKQKEDTICLLLETGE